MAQKFESARLRVRVPERRWKSNAEVEEWARDRLAGGPPSLEAHLPEGHPRAGEKAGWKHVKEGVFSGQFVIVASNPPGLIVTDTSTGDRKFVPSASKSGLVLGKTKAGEFIDSIGQERDLRAFVREENARFNKDAQKKAEISGANWTETWYGHGKRIRDYVTQHPSVSTERLWQELVKWGQGQRGYSRQTHQDATYFYDWVGEVSSDHPVLKLGTTRIQHVLRADRTPEGRNRLLEAILSGPLSGLSDDEFAWLMGQRSKNWPLDDDTRTKFVSVGTRIRERLPLTAEESRTVTAILDAIRKGRREA